MDQLLSLLQSQIPLGPSRPCPYLPNRTARNRVFLADDFDPQLYHELMDRGFRRSGTAFYRPDCGACRECVPIRVPTVSFRPSKSQRRGQRRNADLCVRVGPPVYTSEAQELYARYLAGQHNKSQPDAADGLEDFLYSSPVETLEFQYRLPSGRLIGVGICDVCWGRSLSSVYFYFDPAEADRSLGTFSGVFEIGWSAEHNIPHYYLGFYVRDCRQMNYKSRFQPCELLGADGRWRSYTDADAPTKSSSAPLGSVEATDV